jgi:hypothetical protein
VALEQLAQQRSLEKDSNPRLGKLAMGMMETTWVDCDKFVAAYYGDAKAGREPVEAAKCFKTLCKAMRE